MPGSPRDRIDALARCDKWYLGGLDGVVWAPPFPRWLHRPGFWDPVHLFQHEVGPGFSVALLNRRGDRIRLRGGPKNVSGPEGSADNWTWRPGRLTARWSAEGLERGAAHRRRSPSRQREGRGLAIAAELIAASTETRRILPGGVLDSSWRINPESGAHHLVAYTAQPADAVSGLQTTERGLGWLRSVSDRSGREITVRMELTGPTVPSWRRVIPSEGRAAPEWSNSPFCEQPAGNDSPGEPTPETMPADTDRFGWIWLAVAFRADTARAVPVQLRLSPTFPSAPAARSPQRPDDPAWESFFAGFPAFSSGDPYFDRYFDYRVYGLGLNRMEGRWGNVRRPAIAEGPEYFHVPITYSAQCHMMEMRWRAGGHEAWGSLLNFIDNQKPDGSFHGRLYPDHLERTDFYHANWGDALLAADELHPNPRRLVRCYEGLSAYARWLTEARDAEQSGMFTVLNHFETGQEYMSRYMVVDDEADVAGWRPRLNLKGIDATVYAHQLFRALATIARRLGRMEDATGWHALQTRCGSAITERMWCPEARLYTDVDGRTFERTGVKAAVGFYPMLTGLVDGARLDSMLDHLEDPSTFGTPFPLPSSSVDDPRFSAEGIWRGKRRNCPWNGRAWPMTTSHVIEALLRCWRRGHGRSGALAADLLSRFVRMMFTDGDPGRPNCFEHYNPYTGRACHFRGIDDYQHSWVLDLLARGIAGLHADGEGVEVLPLPHRLEHVSMGPVAVRGRAVTVELDEDRASVTVDGERWSGPRGVPLRVAWEKTGPMGPRGGRAGTNPTAGGRP